MADAIRLSKLPKIKGILKIGLLIRIIDFIALLLPEEKDEDGEVNLVAD